MAVGSLVYTPRPVTISGQVTSGPGVIASFLASTAGTVQLRDGNVSGTIIVATFPVVAGGVYEMQYGIAVGLYAELGGGATGTFAAY